MDVFFNVFAENGQDGIENVFLRNGETGIRRFHDEANCIQFLD
jgi:hypothetical protein